MATVLFVCKANAGRSQISEALFTRAADGRHQALSAGSEADPSGRVHATVVEVMRELGIDLSARRPVALTPELAEQADVVVTRRPSLGVERVRGGTSPDAAIAVPKVWRRSWKRTSRRTRARAAWRLDRRVVVASARRAAVPRVGEYEVVVGVEAAPAPMLAKNAGKATGQRDRPGSALALRRSEPPPYGGAADAHTPRRPIDVLPSEGDELSRAHAGMGRGEDEHAVQVLRRIVAFEPVVRRPVSPPAPALPRTAGRVRSGDRTASACDAAVRRRLRRHPVPMETPIVSALHRWEESGAEWTSHRLSDTEVVIELLTCAGELLEQIRASDPEVTRYVAARPRSGCPPL